MGCLTRFNLKWQPLTEKVDEPNCQHDIPDSAKFCPECGLPVGRTNISEKISQFLKDNRDEFYGIDSEGDTTDEVKWYDYDVNMKKLSKLFMNYLFTLNGKGEESGDIWRTYYLNGKSQEVKAKIVFDEFDKSKLV